MRGDDARRIAQLPVGRRKAIPNELAQDDIFGRGDPRRFTQEGDLCAPPEYFLVEPLRPCQPEIDFQCGADVDGVELMGRLYAARTADSSM